MMVVLKNKSEIERMRKSNRIVAEVLELLKDKLRDGVTSYDIDRIAEEYIVSKGARPVFKGYQAFGKSAFPATLCVSINDEIIHGIPSKKRSFKNGDLVSVDCGVRYDGFCGDAARSYAVGECSSRIHDIMNATERALYLGIDEAKAGNHLFDISHAVQSFVESKGYSVVRQFVGHGIGRDLHEDPQVPNFGNKGKGMVLREGMVLAIEPMVNEGTSDVTENGWTASTADGKLSAHFEHTVAILSDRTEILSVI